MADSFASEDGVGEDFEARRPKGSPVPPGEHPRLTCTAAELEWVKRSAESNSLAGAAVAGLVAQADAALTEPRPPAKWPRDDPAHWDNLVRAVALASISTVAIRTNTHSGLLRGGRPPAVRHYARQGPSCTFSRPNLGFGRPGLRRDLLGGYVIPFSDINGDFANARYRLPCLADFKDWR